MTLQNRVRPDGEIVANPARGLFMGNRGGRFHDPQTRTLGSGRWKSRAWICCTLSYKQFRHDVFGRTYTALFFCDEVTALAAGHRPCVLCRRADALAFRSALVDGLRLDGLPSFPAIDRMLDVERRDGRDKRRHRLSAETLPDGAMIESGDGDFAAVSGDRLLPWSPTGYGISRPRPAGTVSVLTPPSSLAALAAGYRPTWHPSAVTP